MCMFVCVCVCVREREREREGTLQIHGVTYQCWAFFLSIYLVFLAVLDLKLKHLGSSSFVAVYELLVTAHEI